VKLDSSEMFGNPYAFSIYSPQAKTFDISSIGIIDGMVLYFYQDNNFTYYDDKGQIQKVPVIKQAEKIATQSIANILL
jgi:hypothetical protein